MPDETPPPLSEKAEHLLNAGLASLANLYEHHGQPIKAGWLRRIAEGLNPLAEVTSVSTIIETNGGDTPRMEGLFTDPASAAAFAAELGKKYDGPWSRKVDSEVVPLDGYAGQVCREFWMVAAACPGTYYATIRDGRPDYQARRPFSEKRLVDPAVIEFVEGDDDPQAQWVTAWAASGPPRAKELADEAALAWAARFPRELRPPEFDPSKPY